MNSGLAYNKFYDILLSLREEFHKNGRLEDSNAKLDEIIKILMVNFSLAKKGIRFDLKYFREFALINYKNEYSTARALKAIFTDEINSELFLEETKENVFGGNASLNLHDDDNSFADFIIDEISKIDFINLINGNNQTNFDNA